MICRYIHARWQMGIDDGKGYVVVMYIHIEGHCLYSRYILEKNTLRFSSVIVSNTVQGTEL